MSHAETVREHCRAHTIEPARTRGDATFTIRAGDVHAALGLKNRMPLVCSALGAKTFEEENGVEKVSVDGPLNGASATFTYRFR